MDRAFEMKIDRKQEQERIAELTAESKRIWDANASFWHKSHGESGGSFQRRLIGPVVERLLLSQLKEQSDTGARAKILEIACGNGAFTRRLAEIGFEVVACDFSQSFLELAKDHTNNHQEKIIYKLIDATEKQELLTLGSRTFDAVVCNMAMMDMPVIEPLLSAASLLLKRGGSLVFSICHPCFNSAPGTQKVVEQEDIEGTISVRGALKIVKYITPGSYQGLGIIGQPMPQYYFHRPLNILFNTCFDAGFLLDRVEEPVFTQGDSSESINLFDWASFTEIPPVLIARLRLP